MGLRVLHCIRHGQYLTDALHQDYGRLTAIGHRQAEVLAEIYRDFPAAVIHVSTLPRAQQTADPIELAMPAAKRHNSRLLRELIPAATVEHLRSIPALRELEPKELRAALGLTPELQDAVDASFGELLGVEVERERGYRIAQRFFRPWHNTTERHELMVCHGNLIRFLVCLVLGVPQENWLAMDSHHAGITRFTCHPDGAVQLEAYNETMHLPPELWTST